MCISPAAAVLAHDAQYLTRMVTDGAAGLQSPQVLVVDDDDTLRRMTSLILRRSGLRVDEAKDGQEAMDAMRAHRFEVVVLDLMMPRIDGWQVVAWLRQNQQFRPRVLVTLTAATREVLTELDPEIVNTILFKPFDIHELAGYVHACCEGLELPP